MKSGCEGGESDGLLKVRPMLDPDLPLSFFSFSLGVGDGAVPAERRLRREAAAAAPEEVRRPGRLQQGGAHHPEGFQEVS